LADSSFSLPENTIRKSFSIKEHLMQASKNLLRQLPNLDQLSENLGQDTGAIINRAFPTEDLTRPSVGELSFGIGLAGTGEADLPQVEEIDRERWVSAGVRAVSRLKDEGEETDLTGEELIGLEAIVHIEARPAILIQDGHFFPPPTEWQILEPLRDQIERTFKSVGRIELTGHPTYDWVGTGFLVAENVIMTNRHVAQIFCKRGCLGRWDFEPEMTARIDYVEELGSLASAEFALTGVIGVHQDFDLALFTAQPISSSGANLPDPLRVSANPPSDLVGRTVYCVGYPAWDGRRNDPEIMNKIFSNIFNVKRLQPGKTMSNQDAQKQFMHDCSTLGGNSGSCVIDLESNQVIGLHFGGRYLQGNSAIALWKLTNDRLLKRARVNFTS
jgi:hypothetical protein